MDTSGHVSIQGCIWSIDTYCMCIYYVYVYGGISGDVGFRVQAKFRV